MTDLEKCKSYLLKYLTVPLPKKIWEWCVEFGLVVPPDSPLANMSYNPDVMPFWKELLECVTNNDIKQVTCIKPSQIGFTFDMIQIALYSVIHDRSNVLIGFPDDQIAQRFSQQKLKPFILAQNNINDYYNERVSSKFLHNFGTKNIAITGLLKSTSMTMNTYKTVIFDEMSNIATSIGGGKLGDPIVLAKGRVQAFAEESTIIIGGTLILEDGILEREFNLSTQKYYNMPCPCCGEMQPFLFRDLDDEQYKYLKYDIDKNNNVVEGSEYILCRNPKCNFHITNEERIKMIRSEGAKWIANNPKADGSHQGYFLNALYNPFQKLYTIAQAHYKAVSTPEREILQAFTNDYEARSWKQAEFHLDKIHDSIIQSRNEITDKVVFLTMGVDVQKGKDNNNYLVYQIDGWGKNMQCDRIDYGCIYGDLQDPTTWDKLIEVMYKPRYKDLNIDPEPYYVECGFIDVQGGFEREVMIACHREYTNILDFEYIEYPELYPIYGAGGTGGSTTSLLQYDNITKAVSGDVIDPVLNMHFWKKKNKLNVFLWKERLFNDLSIPVNRQNADAYGLVRFVQWDSRKEGGFDKAYFKGLKAEAKYFKIGSQGYKATYMKTRERNEPIDVSVYSMAARNFFISSVSESHPRYEKINELFL